MNMVWIFLLLVFAVLYNSFDKNKKRRYLINLTSGVTQPVKAGLSDSHAKTSYHYTSSELRQLGTACQHRRNIPNFEAIRNIKKFRINKRRTRIQKESQRKVNKSNLKYLELDPEYLMVNVTKTVVIATVNARSVKGKIEEIITILVKNSIDLLLVTETWLRDNENDDIWLDTQQLKMYGYNWENIPRKGRIGGGLLLIIRESYRLTKLDTIEQPSHESYCCRINIGKHDITLLGIYHPPVSSRNQVTDSIFVDLLAEQVCQIIATQNNMIILGDFNIHVNDPNNADSIFLLDAMSSMGFNQIVKSATHKSGNTLDLIFLEETHLFNNFECNVSELLSDHKWVVCQLCIPNITRKKTKIKVRKLDPDHLKIFQDNCNLSKVMEGENMEQMVDDWDKEMVRLYDLIAPCKEVNIANRQRVPWFDDKTKEQKKIVRNRENIWLKYNNMDHHWKAYKRERNRYRNMVRYNKTQIFCDKIQSSKGNTRKLYQLTDVLSGRSCENPLPSATSDENLANEFADFFLNKIKSIRKMFVDIPSFKPEERHGFPAFKKFAPLTENDIRSIIMDMKTKSCELDSLPTNLLKEYISVVLPAITKIVNISLTEGVFANTWKCAIVRPLLKKAGMDLIMKSYRPVSNLSFISKLVEKVALQQFLSHCEEWDLLPDYQSAYRKGFSCETCVIKLVNDVLWGMEKQHITACTFLDLSAAFDTVDHELLLSILSNQFGIKDTALNWYDSYLRPRSFKVNINSAYSDTKDLTFSVPQGSASGANIFTAYCSSLGNIVTKPLTLQGFADDHFIRRDYNANSRFEEANTILSLEKALSTTKTWMDEMRLKLNSDKTEFILFGYRTQLAKSKVNHILVNGEKVQRSSLVRCLGAWLDSEMTMKHHISRKIKTAMFNFKRIRSIRKFLDKSSCETLILTLVVSHLDYCNSILIGLPDMSIKRFQRVQNMCAKLVLLRDRMSSSKQALKDLNWLPIRSRIKFKVLTFLHHCLHGTAPNYLKDIFARLPTPRSGLRSGSNNEYKLLIPKVARKTFAERSVSVTGPRLWNNLPSHIRTEPSPAVFKKILKTFFITQEYY